MRGLPCWHVQGNICLELPARYLLDLQGAIERHALSPLGDRALRTAQRRSQFGLRPEVVKNGLLLHTEKISECRFIVKGNYRPADADAPEYLAMKSVGKRIRDLRRARNLTQPELAKATGLAQSSISEIETGESQSPSALTLVLLAKFFDVDPEHLLTGRGMEHPVSALTDQEAELLLMFRAISPEGREYLLSRVRSVHRDEHSLKNGPNPDGDEHPQNRRQSQ